jgi:uncharacterized coiled-coil protein SlyX
MIPPARTPLRSAILLLFTTLLIGCASAKPAPAPDSTAVRSQKSPPPRVVRETVTVKDPELERRLGRLELRVIEKEAQVEELQTRLEDARDEVVRTMAKLQTLASRAEAASAMAEADVALQSLRGAQGSRPLPELAQASLFVQRSTSEFNKQNYGGALYLANQAKTTATAGRSRLSGANRASGPGETPFAIPVRLKVASRGNVREGPGTGFSVLYAVESGTGLTGFSYTDEWVRVTDDAGRAGWIFRPLVTKP